MITQQFFGHAKCSYKSLIQDTSDSLRFLIFSTESHDIPCEMVSEDQYILDAWGFIELYDHLDAGEVHVNKF